MKCPECGGEVYEGVIGGTSVWACDDCGWCLAGSDIERAQIDEATGTVIPAPENPFGAGGPNGPRKAGA